MMVLVTGGASCGKSQVAEQLCTSLGGNLVYLAAMRPFGEEGARRVRKHRAARAGKGFTTIECYEDFAAVARDPAIEGATVLLECLGNVVANELFAPTGAADADERLLAIIDEIAARGAHVVIVGNEVGCDGVAYPAETANYQRVLGALTCAVAARCDAVIECSCGVPTVLKCAEGTDCHRHLLSLSFERV